MNAALLQSVVEGTAPDLVPLSVEQYHRMIADGILPEGSAIELIDGYLVRKDRGGRTGGDINVVHNSRHAGIVAQLQMLLTQILVGSAFHVRGQLPVTLGETQEPEPDLAVVRGTARDYLKQHPSPADIVLIIEVADSSLKFDRTVKDRLYSAAAIPVYWIVNLIDGTAETYSNPDRERQTYSTRTVVDRDGMLIVSADGEDIAQLAVRDILPE